MQVLEAAPPAPQGAPPAKFWTRDRAIEFAVVIFISAIALAVASHLRSTPYNQAVRQADAWLHGRMWIEWPGEWLEALDYQGHRWAQYAPFPALLMLPFVAIWHLNANQTFMAIAACLVAMGAAWGLLVRLDVAVVPRLWLLTFFLFGTDMLWCSELGDIWFVAHVVAVACTFLALLELTGQRRAWLVALLAYCAAQSRAVMVLAVPLYIFLLLQDDLVRLVPGWVERAGSTARTRLIAFVDTFAAGLLVYVGYNYAKWGAPWDIGYTLYFHQEGWGQPDGSPFRLSYVPYELYSFFMRPPQLVEWRQQAQWPIFKVDPNGVALTFTSPALVLAFLAQMPDRLKYALWATVAALFTANVTYYLNGWYQFGMRHALDFEPFLLVLMAFAVRRKMPVWGAILIAYSTVVGLWGVWWWNAFMRGGS
jgi:hypothetical protein